MIIEQLQNDSRTTIERLHNQYSKATIEQLQNFYKMTRNQLDND
jgi:hypothetical protein